MFAAERVFVQMALATATESDCGAGDAVRADAWALADQAYAQAEIRYYFSELIRSALWPNMMMPQILLGAGDRAAALVQTALLKVKLIIWY
jgi:hypothetical protein